MTHPKLVVVLAAMLFGGSAGTALAQGTGGARAPSPGIGGGGYRWGRRHFHRADAGYRNGRQSGAGITPTPGIGTGTPPNVTPTPRDRNDPESTGTLTGGPPSNGPPARGLRATSLERQASEPRTGPRPRGHQGGNRGRYHLPTMSRQRQISERAADVPWSSGISLLSAVPHAETALVPPGPT